MYYHCHNKLHFLDVDNPYTNMFSAIIYSQEKSQW